MNIIETLEKEEADRLLATRQIPDFQPGDTLRVNVKIKEGERERVQAYEGVCIARGGQGINESFTVRKISFGEGVERLFPVMSPMIESIEVKRPRRRPSRQALLPARPSREVGPDRRAPAGARHRDRGHRSLRLRSNSEFSGGRSDAAAVFVSAPLWGSCQRS